MRQKSKPTDEARYGYKNDMEVPRLDKIVLNMGVGEASQNRGLIEGAVERHGGDRRAEADHHQVPQGKRRVQTARKHAGRRAQVTLRKEKCMNSWIAW